MLIKFEIDLVNLTEEAQMPFRQGLLSYMKFMEYWTMNNKVTTISTAMGKCATWMPHHGNTLTKTKNVTTFHHKCLKNVKVKFQVGP